MHKGIFSTYKTGENRITSSILAVLQSLALTRTERLIGALLDDTEFQLVRFHNQPSKGAAGIPDAIIASNFTILLETKIKQNTVTKGQLKRHLDRLNIGINQIYTWCIVLTPDISTPSEVSEINDSRLIWASFALLHEAINDLLSDLEEVVSEREAFLLRELQSMLKEEGLLTNEKDVVVVPARRAWPEYHKYNVYFCQPNRSHQPVKYLAFYTDGEIKPIVPQILEVYDDVICEPDRYKGELNRLVNKRLDEDPAALGHPNKIFLLTAPDDPRTMHLEQPIRNNLLSSTGKNTAFTQNQRYVILADLIIAKHTSDLV